MSQQKEYSYTGHINTLLHHINSMIEKDWTSEDVDSFNRSLSIQELAKISAMSVRNIQLMFQAYMKETLHQYIIRLRMEQAMYLLKNNRMTKIEISEYIGFANQQAFNNTFKKKYGSTPKKKQSQLLDKGSDYHFSIPSYQIIELQKRTVLFFSYIGNYDACTSIAFEADNWDKLYEYAELNQLLPEKEEDWGICYDDTDITEPEKCRFYACMTIKDEKNMSLSRSNAIKSMYLPGGKYIVYTHKGSYSLLDAFFYTILKQLPSQYKLGNGLILERYLNSPIDTNEDNLLTEVLIPIV